MKIHEYQAKALLKEYGILIPLGELVTDFDAAGSAAERLGVPVMIKAQVQAGGRGKAGGIRTAENPLNAKQIAQELLVSRLRTSQTADEGLLVKKVLVEKKLTIQKEFYVGIVVDRHRSWPVMMVSSAGGMEIEEVSRLSPEKIHKEEINPLLGFRDFQARRLVLKLGIGPELIPQMTAVLFNFYRLFQEKDCLLAEINPLILTGDNQLVALDAKMVFDDYALFRHSDLKQSADAFPEDALEAEAAKQGYTFMRFKGNVGCMIQGAGLAMATMDRLRQLGLEPANFFDISGSAKADQLELALRLTLADPNTKVVLMNFFHSLISPENLINGLSRALGGSESAVPLVIRMMDDPGAIGRGALRKSGLKYIEASDSEDGIQKVLALVKGGGQ